MHETLQAQVFRDSGTLSSLPYRLLVPKPLHGNRLYPLVVFLHGAGERGTDNEAQVQAGKGVPEFITAASHHAYFFLAPQCPLNLSWSGVAWDRLPYQMPPEPTEPMQTLLRLITAITQTHRINRSRIYATGLSMGALGTWDMVMRAPGLFAAGMTVCGGYDADQVERVRDVPFWVFHGSSDPSVPVDGSRAIVTALEHIGGSVKYTEYQGAGHAIWQQAYGTNNAIDWLFHQCRLNREKEASDMT